MVVSIPECQYPVIKGVGVDEPRPPTPSVPVEEEAARFTVSGPLTQSLDDVRFWATSIVQRADQLDRTLLDVSGRVR